jgi:nucleoside-diphosphate-sugar epimerase
MIQRPDVVVHLAARAREPGFPDAEYHQVNVDGTGNVLDWCSGAGVERLWFASSMSFYGGSEAPATESTKPAPWTAYGRSKVAAEQLVESWVESEHGRQAVVVRPAVVFGPGERGNFTRLARALAKRRFLFPGRDDTIKACVHVDELIRALLFLDAVARSPQSKLVIANVAYPRQYTIREICETLCDVGHLPRPWGTVPRSVLLVAAGIGRIARSGDVDPMRVTKVFTSTNIAPAALLELGFAFDTDLRAGLQRWYDADPVGAFV